MNNRRRQKFKVLDEVCDDDYSNFDPDIADALSNLSEQMSETGQKDSVKIADSFHAHFKFTTLRYRNDTSNVSFSVFHWLLKDSKQIIFIENLPEYFPFIFNQVYKIWWLCLK